MTITPYLLIPLLVRVIAQGIKFVLAYFRGDFDLRYLFASGGMPSVHSAVVCSLATVAFIESGFNNPLFGITGILAAIVMYDSFGVRRSAGEQAKTLNTLIADLGECGSIRNADQYDQLRVILGHKPLEVLVGAALGVALTGLFEGAKIAPQLGFLGGQPSLLIIKLIAIKAIVLVLLSAMFAWYVRYRAKNRRLWRPLARRLLFSSIVVAIGLGMLALSLYENIGYFDNWATVALSGVVIAAWYIYVLATTGLTAWQARKTIAVEPRQNKWLKKAKRTAKK